MSVAMGDQERAERIRGLFHAALERPTCERCHFLRAACAGDAALLGEVESLLDAHGLNREFLQAPALKLSAAEVAAGLLAEEGWAAGLRVGAYRLISEIGRGGSGAVYLAARDDDEYSKHVAVKLLKRGPLGGELVRRFRRERQILADLEHPNIARLIDGGTTGTGLPYIVMEYVEGVAVDRYCDEQCLGVEERLRLFREICSAVEFAHRRGIVHRDIKPSNVIVTRDGLPKLIDFGIARLPPSVIATVDPAAAPTVHRAMTPEYASPEQMRGEPVGAASDVYSLGVLLYVLLTGRLPYRLGGESPFEIVRAVCEEEPVRPSAVAPGGDAARGPGVERPRRMLDADLDGIVLKALRKEPGRRYVTAAELSEDVRRHLTGLPVIAREGTLAYRVGKFLRRNRAAALTTLAVAALCLLAGACIALLAGRARGHNSLAVMPLSNRGGMDSAYLADGLTDGLIEELSRVPRLVVPSRNSVFRFKGQDVAPRSVGAALGAGTLLRGDVAAEGDALSVAAELIDTGSGKVIWRRDYEGMRAATLELQRRIADDVARELGLGGGTAVESRRPRGQTKDDEAYRLYLMGRYLWNQRTEGSLRRAVEYFARAAERDPAYALAYAGQADCHALLGAYMLGSPHEHFPAARAAAAKALELDGGLAGPHSTLALVAWLYDWDWEAADAEFRRAIEIDPRYATAHHWRGLFLGEMGRADESVAEMRQALDLDPVSGAAHADFGVVLYWARRYEEALGMFRRAGEIGPRTGDYHVNLERLYEEMGMTAEWLSLHEENGRPLSQWEKEALRKGGFMSLWRARYKYSLPRGAGGHDHAELYARLGKKDEAFRSLSQALAARDHRLSQLRVNPRLDSLRSDPRFADLLRQMKLAP